MLVRALVTPISDWLAAPCITTSRAVLRAGPSVAGAAFSCAAVSTHSHSSPRSGSLGVLPISTVNSSGKR